MPVANLFGLYHSLRISLGTIVFSYALFYSLMRKNHYLLLLVVPVYITLFDFVHDLALVVNLGMLG